MVIGQRLQAGLPFHKEIPPFEIVRCDDEIQNWRLISWDRALLAVARDLQAEFELNEE